MKTKLNKFEFVSISIMLFGLFFGAGNLIFPPMLGYNSGNVTLTSFAFFALTAVLFPILGVIAVAKTDGLQNLANRVHPTFALVYTLAIYLSIGPGLVIPRAGTVPFEMAISQYLPQDFDVTLARLVYIFIFFLISYFVALSPSSLVQSTGKFLTPVLIGFIVLLFVGVLFNNPGLIASPKGVYADSPAVQGFIDGFNTMDAVAALNFGLVIAATIRRYKVEDKNDVVEYTKKSGFVAGAVLLIVYAMLTFVGVQVSGSEQTFENGAQVLTYVSHYVFGDLGAAVVIFIFTLACLTTSIGLIVSISEYFATLSSKVTVRQWTAAIAFFSFVLGNFGLNTLLAFSVPVLLAIYPFSLVLIVMGVLHDKVKFTRASYITAAVTTMVFSTVAVLKTQNVVLPLVTNLFESLPFAKSGLEWVLPTLILVVLVQLFTRKK